jgi:hypothetical protein
MRRRGEKADAGCTLMAIALRSGTPVWTQSLSPTGGGEYLACSPESGVLLHYRQMSRLRTLDAKTGTVLWERPFRVCCDPIMVGPCTFYAFEPLEQIHISGWKIACNIYDVRSGDLLRGNVFRSEQFGCNYTHAAASLLVRRDINTFAAFVDMGSGEVCRMGNVRSGCTQSLIPAAGLVVGPNLNIGCGCNYPVQTSFALVPSAVVAAPPVRLRQPVPGDGVKPP